MWTEEKLNELLTTPSADLIADIRNIQGDIMVLGAGGKMGPTLCVLAKNAIRAAGIQKRVIAVSRFTDPLVRQLLTENEVEMISCDLLDVEALNKLPDVENVIFMAGKKFGTNGAEWQTWAMNSTLPSFVAHKFRNSSIVVFSSGNIYPLVPAHSGGCTEDTKPVPVGDYTQSCLARERAFEYAANAFGTKVFLFRLNYAVDLRYGVLHDIASSIVAGTPIRVRTPAFNVIWQGSANEIAIRGLIHAASPACVMNVTGPETVSVRQAAWEMAKYLGKDPIFEGEEGENAYLSNSALAMETFGYPAISIHKLMRWQAQWILDGGRALGKPTHFEERGGKY